MTSTEAQQKATKKYIKNNLKRYALQANVNTDPDLIKYFDKCKNINGFLKCAAREKLARDKGKDFL